MVHPVCICLNSTIPYSFQSTINSPSLLFLFFVWLLWSYSLGLHFNELNQFFSFPYLIWSLQTLNCEEIPYRNSLISCLSPFHKTHVCLMANLVLLNLTLFLTVHFCAVHGYTATHMRSPHVHASLPFCHHHAVTSCYSSPLCLP